MTKANIVIEIIIPIASVVVIALAVTLSFIIKKMIKKSKRDKIIHNLYEHVSYDRLSKFNSEVSRINVLANTNPKYDRLANDLTLLFDKLDETFADANQILQELNNLDDGIENSHNKYKMSNKDFLFKVEEIDERIRFMREIEVEFEVVASQITHQDEFLKSEFTLYQTNLRKAVEVYRVKRLLLDKVSKKIDEIILVIKSQESQFNDAILSGNMKEASEILKNYSKLVIKFAEIINEGPAIQTYIFDVIPKTIKVIVDNFNQRKNELQGSIGIINFEESIKIAASIYQEAKAEYEKLNINKAKDLIRKVLKSIKATEKIINLEIRSRNAVMNSFKDITLEVKNTLKRYVELKEQFRILIGKGVKVPLELNDLFIEVRTSAKEVDEKAIKFNEMVADKTIPFSSKMQRSKMLIQLSIDLTIKMNDIMQILWAINIESSLIRNKFKQAESAINEIMSNIKRQNILITLDEEKEFEVISKKINELAEKIKVDNIAKDIAEEINLLVTNVISFYKTVGSKIQIAEMVGNVIREFSPRRALDEKINYALMQSEKLYLEGKYAEALNVVVSELEGGKK